MVGILKNWLLILLGGAGCLIIVFAFGYYWNNIGLSVMFGSAEWGQFGDFIGGTTNPLLSLLAFLGVLYTIHQNSESQKEQALLMKETAALSAINQIYDHYSGGYGAEDKTGILSAVASGHKRWAIRESFNTIDNVFTPDRVSQVKKEESQLAELLMVPRCNQEYMTNVALRTASLLVDTRADIEFRRTLWPLYEIMRSNPAELCDENSILYSAFKDSSKGTVAVWRSIKT